MFVTLEGIEAGGKSTLMASLAAHLRSDGRSVVTAHEPGGTPAGDRIREVFLSSDIALQPIAEIMLVNASRVHLVSEVIKPALANGLVVLCDRFVDSTVAYQSFGRGIDRGMLEDLCKVATGGLAPDLTLLIDIPVEVSRARVESRHEKKDRMDRQPQSFYERVRAGYLALARGEPKRVHVIDGTANEQAVLRAALDALRLPAK